MLLVVGKDAVAFQASEGALQPLRRQLLDHILAIAANGQLLDAGEDQRQRLAEVERLELELGVGGEVEGGNVQPADGGEGRQRRAALLRRRHVNVNGGDAQLFEVHQAVQVIGAQFGVEFDLQKGEKFSDFSSKKDSSLRTMVRLEKRMLRYWRPPKWALRKGR